VENRTVRTSRVVCLTVRKPISVEPVPRLGGLKTFINRPLARKTHIDATSGIRRRLSQPHCQSIATCATHVSLMFAEIPKMETPHERQVVQNLKLQLAHARHDGERRL
jgi:hypothetical protein